MRSSQSWSLRPTFQAGDLGPLLAKKVEELERTISAMSASDLDGPPLAAARAEAEVGPLELRDSDLDWDLKGPGIMAEVTVLLAGNLTAVLYDSSDAPGRRRIGGSSPLDVWLLDNSKRELVAAREWTTPPPSSDVKAWRDEVTGALTAAVTRANAMINAHTASLAGIVDTAVAKRRTEVDALRALEEDLGPAASDRRPGT